MAVNFMYGCRIYRSALHVSVLLWIGEYAFFLSKRINAVSEVTVYMHASFYSGVQVFALTFLTVSICGVNFLLSHFALLTMHFFFGLQFPLLFF